MKLRPIRKDPRSNQTNCPGLYEVVDGQGGHVVVGHLVPLDAGDLAYGLREGEVAVYVPPGVIED